MPELRPIDRWFIDEVLPHERRYIAVARALTGSEDDARDLVQEVYVTLAYDYIVYQTTVLNGGNGAPPTDTRLVDAAPRSFFSGFLSYHLGPFAANLSLQQQSSTPTMGYNPVNDRRETYAALLGAQVSYALTSNLRFLMEGQNILHQDIVDRYAVTGYGPAYQVKNNGRTLWFGLELTLL
jgi:outer membrane receptor for ferrienterochelin and colicin